MGTNAPAMTHALMSNDRVALAADFARDAGGRLERESRVRGQVVAFAAGVGIQL